MHKIAFFSISPAKVDIISICEYYIGLYVV